MRQFLLDSDYLQSEITPWERTTTRKLLAGIVNKPFGLQFVSIDLWYQFILLHLNFSFPVVHLVGI